MNQLQRDYGNSYVQRILNLQRKRNDGILQRKPPDVVAANRASAKTDREKIMTKYGWLVKILGSQNPKYALDVLPALVSLGLAEIKRLAPIKKAPAPSPITRRVEPDIEVLRALRLGGVGWSHSIDWNKPVGRYVKRRKGRSGYIFRPAKGYGRATARIKPTKPGIEPATPMQLQTLRDYFVFHFIEQIQKTFGVSRMTFRRTMHALRVAQRISQKFPRLWWAQFMAQDIRCAIAQATQYAVVETLNVTAYGKRSGRKGVATSRYTSETETYCNVYAHDYVHALGGYLPRVWWCYPRKVLAWKKNNPGAQLPIKYTGTCRRVRRNKPIPLSKLGRVHELSANGLWKWMRNSLAALPPWGEQFGWKRANNFTEAQEAANDGKIVVIMSKGHVAVILAESPIWRATRDKNGKVTGPVQSQAGGVTKKFWKVGAWWWKKYKGIHYAYIFQKGMRKSPLASPEEMGAKV